MCLRTACGRARASDPGGTRVDGPVPLRADYGRSACGVLHMLQDRMWHTSAARVSEDAEGGFASLFSALESLIRQNVKNMSKQLTIFDVTWLDSEVDLRLFSSCRLLIFLCLDSCDTGTANGYSAPR